jgi:hypothetical protein
MNPKLQKIGLIAGIIVILVVWGLLYWLICTPPPARAYDYDWPGKKQVMERMRYHGLWGCIQDETGYYFMRDGKRCKL